MGCFPFPFLFKVPVSIKSWFIMKDMLIFRYITIEQNNCDNLI